MTSFKEFKKELLKNPKFAKEYYRIPKKFHDLYEEVAPKFGYKTRQDTKEFNPNSKNGKLMTYVCNIIVMEEIELFKKRLLRKTKNKNIKEFILNNN